MQVELHPEAQAETRRAAIWYDERQLGLGDQFLAAVTGTLAGVAATPRAYPVWIALPRGRRPGRSLAHGRSETKLVVWEQ